MYTTATENIKGYCFYYGKWCENANGFGYCKFTACTKGLDEPLRILTTSEMEE